jgi:alpha-L-rhamnosidase
MRRIILPSLGFLLIALASCIGRPAGGLRTVGLRCEYRQDPLGIDTDRPRLSWGLESTGRGQRQSAYRLLVASSADILREDIGDLWDTGRLDSDRTVNIEYDGAPLTSGQRCYWKIMAWDEAGEPSPWSAPAWWETALLEQDDWTGVWIGDGRPDPERDEDFYLEDPAPLLRRGFQVDRTVRRARLSITGLGYYEAYLNGERIGDHVLDPGWTDYRDRVFYSTYDVTALLRQGENALGAELGNGWYNPLPMRMWGRRNLREALPTGRPRLLAQLTIDFEDGTTLSIATDDSWRTHPGPVLRNNIFLGEVYDARREIDGWSESGFDDSTWERAAVMPESGGRLEAQPQPPVRITRTLKPFAITEPAPGVFIFDFGQNFAGWVRLRLKGEAGTRVKLRFGELLHPDGTLNPMTSVAGQIKGTGRDGISVGGPGAPQIAWQEDTYIARGQGVESYTQRFTFHAFRYVEVTGYPGRPGRADLTGLRLNSDVEEAGSFTCSNDLLNRIQEMVRWTFLSNIFSVQSDCPHRERFGYGGDLVVTSDAFMMNFEMADFYPKTVRDWHDAALPDGMLTDTAPFVGIHYCGVAWAMAHPHLLESLYRYYGDRRLMEEQYATASQWLAPTTSSRPA